MTAEEAELSLLSLANEKRKLGVEVNYAFDHQEMQDALERSMDHDWLRLVDIVTPASMPGHLLRIFRLTDAGMARMASLKNWLGKST